MTTDPHPDAAFSSSPDSDQVNRVDSPDADADRSNRTLPALLIVLALLLVLTGGVWWAGGFAPATGRLFRLPVGTEVDMGPMSITIDRALARQGPSGWSLYVFARCRNNTDEPVVSTKDRLVASGFSAQHPISKTISADASLFFGPGDTLGNSTVLNPGTPMVPCQLVLKSDDFPATDSVSVGVSQLEWIDSSPTGEGNMVWSAARVGYRFEVPVVTQPDQP